MYRPGSEAAGAGVGTAGRALKLHHVMRLFRSDDGGPIESAPGKGRNPARSGANTLPHEGESNQRRGSPLRLASLEGLPTMILTDEQQVAVLNISGALDPAARSQFMADLVQQLAGRDQIGSGELSRLC